MEQRARLKNLDNFVSGENCLLIATDVAARGLDIPNIDHVIHYQVNIYHHTMTISPYDIWFSCTSQLNGAGSRLARIQDY